MSTGRGERGSPSAWGAKRVGPVSVGAVSVGAVSVGMVSIGRGAWVR